MKKLINSIADIVPQALEGFVRFNPNLSLVDGHTIIVRSDIEVFRSESKVAIVTGGGAGHEPAHAGYVGKGMLTAAVSGDVFASPGTDAVLTALRTIAPVAGVLLIVKNYTGDRLNFGLAAEIAKAEGMDVELVVVDDDAALGSAQDTAGRRGIAGTVLVHKIAGAAAESGLSLQQVKTITLAAINDVASMGVALSSCTVPSAGKPNFVLGEAEIELGLGIHGEAGVERTELQTAQTLVDTMLDKIIADQSLLPGDNVVLLVNNLGATPPMEQFLVGNDTLKSLAVRGLNVKRCWCGTFLTAIEMAGISLSLMRVDDERLALLDMGTEAPAWPRQNVISTPRTDVSLPAILLPNVEFQPPGPAGAPLFLSALKAACEVMVEAEPKLTDMDQIVGDGDIGRSLAGGAQAILNRLDELMPLSDAQRLREISTIIRKSIGGTSGPLYAILAMGASHVVATGKLSGVALVAAAFSGGVDAVSVLGGAKTGDRTMVDALAPAAAAMAQADNIGALFDVAQQAAREGTDKTADMVARLGRTSYIGKRAIGHKDPGAEAVAIWLLSICDHIKNSS